MIHVEKSCLAVYTEGADDCDSLPDQFRTWVLKMNQYGSKSLVEFVRQGYNIWLDILGDEESAAGHHGDTTGIMQGEFHSALTSTIEVNAVLHTSQPFGETLMSRAQVAEFLGANPLFRRILDSLEEGTLKKRKQDLIDAFEVGSMFVGQSSWWDFSSDTKECSIVV